MLNKVPIFEGIDYEHTPYSELENQILAMADIGWEVHDLGLCSDGEKTIYGISLGDLDNKPVIYFQAQIHGGHEWQTSHWALEFCRRIVNADHPYHRAFFNKIKQKYAIYVIPCVNPYGYDPVTNSYANANGVAIDANFDYNWSPDVPYHSAGPYAFSEPESQVIRNIFETYKPLSLICCHTHGGYDGIAVRPNTNYKFDKLLTHAATSAALSLDVWDEQYSGAIHRLNRATAYNWAGVQRSSYGLPIPGCAIEPGSNETDFDKSVFGMTTLFSLIMQLDKYYSTVTQ